MHCQLLSFWCHLRFQGNEAMCLSLGFAFLGRTYSWCVPICVWWLWCVVCAAIHRLGWMHVRPSTAAGVTLHRAALHGVVRLCVYLCAGLASAARLSCVHLVLRAAVASLCLG
jgi:hypothetical protein